jgi:patatin-related protein
MSSVAMAGSADEGAALPQPSAVTGATQDVRFAVVMSGGVSLAVWMGGVAREVNLLQEASNSRGPDEAGGAPLDTDGQSRDLYRKLLQVLDVSVTVDVLSGTSAGGINAALLGLSSAAGADLAGLRDLWLTTGSMDILLRDPGEKDPPSLMQGDKVLFANLASGIKLVNGARKQAYAPRDPETTVFITTTMLSGETSRFTDDYGTLVPDVDHHGLFTFDQEALVSGDASSLAALALAARSSASFPGAFEPSFVPVRTHVPEANGIPGRPDMAGFANMTRSHWVADGGLLANRPLTPLLSAVLARPAASEVRRVLAFVVPDGGGTASPAAIPAADQWTRPLTMAGALKADLNAQTSQSIASDLQAIRAHNEQITASHDLRSSLAEMGSRLRPAGLVTARLLAGYQRQQGDGLTGPLLAQVMRQLTPMQLPKEWAAELSPARPGEPAETQMADAMAAILGAGWQPGFRPEGPPDQERVAWAGWTATADPLERAARFGLPAFRAAQSTAEHLIRLGTRQATSAGQRQQIIRHRPAIDAALEPSATPGWDEQAEVAAALKAGAGPDTALRLGLMQVASQLADSNRAALLIGGAELRTAWAALADAVIALLDDLAPMLATEGRQSRIEAAGEIRTYLDYLGHDGPGQESRTATMADRLLNLVIAERALLPADPAIDQPVEFIQVSANTRTLIAPGEDTVHKLRGAEFHHFAAFYKSSWRAYDWMWGRLDGSGWLVHILLDPRRILAVAEDREWAHGERAQQFAGLLRDNLGLAAGLPGDCLAEDLAFLDQPDAVIPVSLPRSALFLVRAWQDLIAANELPVVAERILADGGRLPPLISPANAAGGEPPPSVRGWWRQRAARRRHHQPLPAPPDAWVTNVLNARQEKKDPAYYATLLPSCPVRRESLAGEVRTPAFARLATKAAAVATAAISVAPEVPRAVRPVLTSARAVTRTGYLATKATGGSGWKTLVAGLVMGVVGGLLATQGAVVVGLTGTVILLAGLYLIALGAWGIHRGLLGAIIAFTALVLVGSTALSWGRTEIWGTSGNSKSGIVARDVLPWLRSSWWGGLALLGGIILLAVLLSLLTRGRPRPDAAPVRTP